MKICDFFTTGELAKLTGISKQLLIFYDKKGIFSSASIQSNGYRHYSLSSYFQLKILLSLRKIGISLDETCEYLKSGNAITLKKIYSEKITEYEKEISILQQKTCILRQKLSAIQEQERQCFNQVLLTEIHESVTYLCYTIDLNTPIKERISNIARILLPYLKNSSCLNDSIKGYSLSTKELSQNQQLSSYDILIPIDITIPKSARTITMQPGLYAIIHGSGHYGVLNVKTQKLIFDFIERNHMIPSSNTFIFPDDSVWMNPATHWPVTVMIQVFPS